MDMEELRRHAFQAEDNRAEERQKQLEAGKQAANADLPIWKDAIERKMKAGSRGVWLQFDPAIDYREDRRIAKQFVPLLSDWSHFCTRPLAARRAYQEELSILLGVPFKVQFTTSDKPMHPPQFMDYPQAVKQAPPEEQNEWLAKRKRNLVYLFSISW